MKLSKRCRQLVLLSGLSLFALPALSQTQDNWYIGGSINQAFVDEAGIDDDDTGFKVFGGYRFSDYFAIEASYYDLGDVSEGDNSFSVDGGSLRVMGSIPVSRDFSLFGKVGMHAWNADVGGAIAGRFSDDSDTDVFYGVGAEYRLTGPWSVRGELERYEVDDFDVDQVSVGVAFHF